MNQIWSKRVQGIYTLYLSRELRFSDEYEEQFKELFRISEKEGRALKILEIGCGPGALAKSLRRWYQDAEIIGLDRDSEFIAFAKKQEAEVTFVTGDATELPFEDASFDVTISNTVCEHIEPSQFYREQMRVLKPGGICLVLSSRRGISIQADCLALTEYEKAFWKREEGCDNTLEQYGIGKYAMSESELPRAMEKYGFRNVSVGYVTEDFTPDSASCSRERALAIIEEGRMTQLEAIDSAEYCCGNMFQQDRKSVV